MEVFNYGTRETEYLKKRDKRLGAAIKRIGKIEHEVIPDLFTALANCIIAQQISTKAAGTIWSRMRERFGEITPATIDAATLEEIQQCGMAMRKAEYIKGIADWAARSPQNIDEFFHLPDDEVISRLCSLNGVGVWTAEMVLIF